VQLVGFKWCHLIWFWWASSCRSKSSGVNGILTGDETKAAIVIGDVGACWICWNSKVNYAQMLTYRTAWDSCAYHFELNSLLLLLYACHKNVLLQFYCSNIFLWFTVFPMLSSWAFPFVCTFSIVFVLLVTRHQQLSHSCQHRGLTCSLAYYILFIYVVSYHVICPQSFGYLQTLRWDLILTYVYSSYSLCIHSFISSRWTNRVIWLLENTELHIF
jgi:hypothetical protein